MKSRMTVALLVAVMLAGLFPGSDAYAESDLDAYMRGKKLRMWVNDDADKSDAESDPVDIPKQSNADCKDGVVNGRRDLVDFVPMWLNLSSFAPWLSSGRVVVRLSHPDSALNIVWTKLGNREAGRFHREDVAECGPELNQNAYEATVTPITAEGIEVPQSIIDMILADPSKGIVMMEGTKPSDMPFKLALCWRNTTQELFTFKLPMTVSHVEDMYRWGNIRAAAGGTVGAARGSRLSEPTGLPDAETNGKHLVFVHGYSVSEEKARGWAAEMFKRMWQSGANCAFTAVTWYGDDSRKWWYLNNTPNYYVNVEHAFESAPALAGMVAQLPGEKVVAAHSLGNMLVSSAIVDEQMLVSAYFMLNAAVPLEAYDADEVTDESSHNMANPDWHAYANRLWASRWHEAWERLDPNDGRCGMTWRGRFGNIANAYNYYSTGDEVLTNGNGTVQFLLSGDFAWYNQESRKGQWPMLLPGNNEAGWSFNGAYDTLMFHMSPENAANLSDDMIRTNSFFGLFDEVGLYGTNGSVLATQPAVRQHALADGIPAESYAAGANRIGNRNLVWGDDRNINMPAMPSVLMAWDRLYGVGHNQAWKHSDIKERPYQVVRDVFMSIIENGDLR